MTPEFEQAKREIAEKYFPVSSGFEHSRIYVELQKNIQNGFLSDLTALLEQHKEMMLREELIKYDKYIGSRGWIDNYEDWAAITSVDEYLKSREK